MCGVVGYTGSKQAAPWLLDGLQTLEYRGYDSAGIQVVSPSGNLHGVKCAGRVAALRERAAAANPTGTCGIGHTRWATHGAPTDRNAHPHLDGTGRIAVVHNGIIENFQELRRELLAAGHVLVSDTDTEVIPHLIQEAWEGPAKGDLAAAVRNATDRLEGSWAIAVVCADCPGTMVVTRNGSPLVVASTDDGAYAASDVMPLASVTSHVIQLNDGDVATLTPDGGISITDRDGRLVNSPATFDIDWDASAAKMGGYSDFMAKEISEQPEAIERLLKDRLGSHGIELDELSLTREELAAIDKIVIIGCGTSYHVGLVAKAAIERWAKVPVAVEYASEFNYNEDYLVTDHTMCLVITQSGETADTLTAARRMRGMGCTVFAITNVLGSTAAREADGTLYIQAGPEVAVASTKAYTAQMLASYLLALRLAYANGNMTLAEVEKHYRDFEQVPDLMREVLSRRWQDKQASQRFRGKTSSLFLGRNVSSTTAYEGALKLKEISYLHAEAYPSGEMKHGPISLIESGFPVVAVVPADHVHDKTVSNIQECLARGAVVVAVATDGDERVAKMCQEVLWVPPCPDQLLIPAVSVIHLQLLARYVARDRGYDVDKPRNLAKSVTVE
jgi:glucosamine--fructose-6-phosphate aminotransferase (isomerizing)